MNPGAGPIDESLATLVIGYRQGCYLVAALLVKEDRENQRQQHIIDGSL